MGSNEYTAEDINVIDTAKMTLAELVAQIEKRTLMFLPERHICYAATFLSGYLHGKSNGADWDIMCGFDRYIDAKFRITTTHGWARNILHLSSDPHSALDYFFRLFKEYQQVNCLQEHSS